LASGDKEISAVVENQSRKIEQAQKRKLLGFPFKQAFFFGGSLPPYYPLRTHWSGFFPRESYPLADRVRLGIHSFDGLAEKEQPS
jgi:hypothetical protein